MPRVVIVGGSAAGLAAAVVLARRGHAAVVLERDPVDPVESLDEAIAGQSRPGVPHGPQGHAFLARAHQVPRQELPGVLDALVTLGARPFGVPLLMPAAIEDRSPAPGDEEITVLGSRRATVDWALRRAAAEPRVELRDHVVVSGLVARSDNGVVRVTGVRANGAAVPADIVIDATGRRSKISDWLVAAGAPEPPFESAECGLVYYTRHYRLRPGASAPRVTTGFSTLRNHQTFTSVRFPGDRDTVQMALAVHTDDAELKQVRVAEAHTAALRRVPWAAAWLDAVEPISDVFAMDSLLNTLRRLVRDGRPVALGIHAIGDATRTTNPTFGRGVSLAFHQVQTLARVLDEHPDDLERQALAMDEDVSRYVEPWYRNQAAADSARLAQVRSALLGTPPPPAPPPVPNDTRLTIPQVAVAAQYDPVVWRAATRRTQLLEPPDAIWRNEDVIERVRRTVAEGREMPLPPPEFAEPDRGEVLAAVRDAVGRK